MCNCAGLNLQIEHHLFPCVAHHHYAEIQKVVEDECAKRGITYTKFTTLPEARSPPRPLLTRSGLQGMALPGSTTHTRLPGLGRTSAA